MKLDVLEDEIRRLEDRHPIQFRYKAVPKRVNKLYGAAGLAAVQRPCLRYLYPEAILVDTRYCFQYIYSASTTRLGNTCRYFGIIRIYWIFRLL